MLGPDLLISLPIRELKEESADFFTVNILTQGGPGSGGNHGSCFLRKDPILEAKERFLSA